MADSRSPAQAIPGGQTDEKPRWFTTPDAAVKVLNEFKRILQSDETQRMFGQRLNFTDPNIILEIREIMLHVTYETLDNTGFGHMKQLFGPHLVPNVMLFILGEYHENLEVMKVAEFVTMPSLQIQPPSLADVGGPVPNIGLVSLDGKTVKLAELHVNKDRPMLIMASSVSSPVLMGSIFGGTMAGVFREFGTHIDLLFVYLAEAHPKGALMMGKLSYMKQHESMEERIGAANGLFRLDSKTFKCMTNDITNISKFRIVVDQMDNLFSRTFKAHPDRAILVRNEKIAHISSPSGYSQMKEPTRFMTHEARDWLLSNVPK